MATTHTIMLVEDDLALRDIYQTRLEAEGFAVSVVADGEAALAEAIRIGPQLILLDLMMPKIDGFAVLDILKGTPATKDCKVIVLSALSEEEDRSRARQLGADDYIVKSDATLNDIVTTVEKHLTQL